MRLEGAQHVRHFERVDFERVAVVECERHPHEHADAVDSVPRTQVRHSPTSASRSSASARHPPCPVEPVLRPAASESPGPRALACPCTQPAQCRVDRRRRYALRSHRK